MYDVTDKVALITSGTRGIGFAIAEDLLAAGARVVLNGRSETEEAAELQTRAENIRVNVLAPGIIRTRFHDAMSDQAKAHNLDKRIPLKREGSPENVAQAARQLIENDFVTGEMIVVDGGMSMRVTG